MSNASFTFGWIGLVALSSTLIPSQSSLKSTYFSYNGEFYEQRQGAAMGSPVSAVVANLYMEFFGELALESASRD